MEIWYDPATMEVKAVYSNRYAGTVWENAGWVSLEEARALPRDMMPGARVAVADGVATVVTVAPVPPVDPKVQLLATLHAKLGDDSITDSEIRDLLRLERGL